MSVLTKKVKEEIERLTSLRDELRVQLDLGSKDARRLFEQAEPRWQELETKAREIATASSEAATEIAAAAMLLGESLRDAYAHVRSKL